MKVMLNSFQHLTASLNLPPSLGEILKQVQDDIVHGVICYLYTHFSEANSILLSITTHNSSSNRLRDGLPKANSRGFLNPWRKDISLKSV